MPECNTERDQDKLLLFKKYATKCKKMYNTSVNAKITIIKKHLMLFNPRVLWTY